MMLLPTRGQWTRSMLFLQSASREVSSHMITTAGEANNSLELKSAFRNLEQAAFELGYELTPRLEGKNEREA